MTNKLINIKKVLEYLRNSERFNSRHLFDAEKIATGDREVILELLFDIHDFYCKNEKLPSKSLSPSKKGKKMEIIKNKLNTMDDNKTNLLENGQYNNLSSRLDASEYKNKFYEDKKNKKQPSQYHNRSRAAGSKAEYLNEDKNNKTVFVTLDYNNVKKLERKIISSIDNSDRRNDSFRNIYYSQTPIKKDKKQVNFMRLDIEDNNYTNNTILQPSASLSFKNLSKTHSEEKKVKDWLFSLGLNFAFDIDFNKPEVAEFKNGLLLIKIISSLDSENKFYGTHHHPNSRSAALLNIRKVLEILKSKKNIPSKFLHCEEEIYKGETKFILSFLSILMKVYSREKEFNEKFSMTSKSLNNSSLARSKSSTPNDNYNQSGYYTTINQDKRKFFLQYPKYASN